MYFYAKSASNLILLPGTPVDAPLLLQPSGMYVQVGSVQHACVQHASAVQRACAAGGSLWISYHWMPESLDVLLCTAWNMQNGTPGTGEMCVCVCVFKVTTNAEPKVHAMPFL